MCALEAFACGVPIISTPTDGLNDIIDNQKTGFLSNDNKQIVDYVIKVLTEKKILKDGTKVEVPVKVGETVMFEKYAGSEVKYEGKEYLIVAAKDIMAVVE